ncbi:MAG: PAS domain S-box protein [Gemmatimonadales bacterium]|nr:PAS domain S-box protein [Gemmatimonadales bacterium]MBA3553456.1 PAS domain S-box protein [Gemmatimonadales bacterium]
MRSEAATALEAAPPATEQPRTGKRSLPDQRTLLSWLFVGRLVLAVGILLGAGLVWTERPQESFLVSIAVLIALTFTAYGAWTVYVRQGRPGNTFLMVQSLVDLGVVTTIVHFAGQPQSAFPALYVLIVAAYALLLPPAWGAITAILASALYLGDAFLGHSTLPNSAFWAQMVVFNMVFAIVAVLGHRLREAGMEQETLATELKRVRLEADDILRNIRSGVLTVDGFGRLAFINPTGQRLLDLDGEQLIGQPVLDQLKTRSSELWAAVVAGIRNGRKISRGEGTVLHQAGRMFPIGLSTTTFRQEAQEAPSVTAIFTDISDLKEVQELQARAERLESVAALSASLAHEIRNPLASIRSSVEQLARSRYADEDERFLAGLIVRESDRLSRLLSEFLDFARVRATQLVPIDLHAVITAVIRLIRAHPDCRSDAELVVEGERTTLDGDEDLLHRVVANLVLNAVQAARGPVRVTVSVASVQTGEIPHGTNLDHAVRLQVRDTGPGIPEEIRERLFDPFVSARPGGSGLGLAIVQRAVEAHRGLVLVDSAPDTGTTFTIFLPAKILAEDAA